MGAKGTSLWDGSWASDAHICPVCPVSHPEVVLRVQDFWSPRSSKEVSYGYLVLYLAMLIA